jgi:hypothetical protein
VLTSSFNWCAKDIQNPKPLYANSARNCTQIRAGNRTRLDVPLGAGYTSDFVSDFMSDLLLYLRFGVAYGIATVYT